MPRLDAGSLKNAAIYIGEKNYTARQRLYDLCSAQGLKHITAYATVKRLRDDLAEQSPDLLLLADDFDPTVYDLVREIRFHKLGDNPFLLISMLVSPARRNAVALSIGAGVDDIILKPLTAERIQERLKLVTFHRRPFISTGDYLGPERKTEETVANVHRISVINTLFEKVNGRDLDKLALKAAVEGSLQMIFQAQLDRQSFTLGEVCERLVQAYESGSIDIDVQADLMTLGDVLKDAAGVALRLKDEQLSVLCLSLADGVNQIADHYAEPTEREIDLIRKVTTAFKMAMRPVPLEESKPEVLDITPPDARVA